MRIGALTHRGIYTSSNILQLTPKYLLVERKRLMTRAWSRNRPLIQRHPDNPILTAADWPYRANTVFNPGATLLQDGSTLLLCRVEDFTEELWGIEDPRITYVLELKQYAILYTAYSRGGPGVSMALTKDFRTFERLGVVMSPEDKDAALLPRRINGEWALIHRPVGSVGAHMWLSFSNDLKHWGTHKLMLEARRGAWWDANKIGLCNPPIETDRGWLVVYHGVRHTAAGSLYRLGLALFDL